VSDTTAQDSEHDAELVGLDGSPSWAKARDLIKRQRAEVGELRTLLDREIDERRQVEVERAADAETIGDLRAEPSFTQAGIDTSGGAGALFHEGRDELLDPPAGDEHQARAWPLSCPTAAVPRARSGRQRPRWSPLAARHVPLGAPPYASPSPLRPPAGISSTAASLGRLPPGSRLRSTTRVHRSWCQNRRATTRCWGGAMSRLVCSVMVVAAGLVVIAASASAAPDEDFVVGSGEIVVVLPGFPPVVLGVFIDAHSDASGGNPGGTVDVFVPSSGSIFNGPVTCLVVTDNRAIIGFEDASDGHVTAEVVDNSATGGPDTFAVILGQTGCAPVSEPFPLVSGDFVVHDALPLTSKDQCKDGGWRDFTDDQGRPFDNQGECIGFVQHAT
jgi:hypothetical protein